MATKIIGLSGKKQSGKDTFAQALIDNLGYTRVAFADPLKEMLYALDPLVVVRTDETGLLREAGMPAFARGLRYARITMLVDSVGWDGAKQLHDVRSLLQRLGTEAGRKVMGESIWVDTAMRRAAEIDGPVVITDMRFPNEKRAVEFAGGWSVRIERPGLAQDPDAHASETALDAEVFDFQVVNGGTVADLQSQAGRIHSYFDLLLDAA
ncbi:hypothetical protein [Cellulomonas sp. SG140]|uniref:deoxynucleotide monophosphate kinase family protein n=1 Tax=Cellulomonas sp. SG140 TaxID=2976536 RepID=UPI0021E8757E|nr:hypothetical protein [Cellulomonas sp. SG140]